MSRQTLITDYYSKHISKWYTISLDSIEKKMRFIIMKPIVFTQNLIKKRQVQSLITDYYSTIIILQKQLVQQSIKRYFT